MTFHLVDLISQCFAVERLLRDLPEPDKLAWLSQYGEVVEIPAIRSYGFSGYVFRSFEGCEAKFFFRNGRFVFVGDHSTFRPGE